MAASAIIAFLGAPNNAANIFKAALETRDKIKLGELHFKFTEALLDLKTHQLGATEFHQALAARNESLKNQIAAYQRRDQESERYQLHEPQPGIRVCTLNPEHATGQPAHWFCAACYADGKNPCSNHSGFPRDESPGYFRHDFPQRCQATG